MKAVVVTPKQAGTGRVQEVPTPEPAADQALVEVIEVGVCGTDLEILHGLYGEAPPGDDYLIIGHENFGKVVSAPAGSDLSPGDHVVAIVRRPDPVPCPQCGVGEFDMCSNGQYTERGIKGRHGYMSEYYVETPQYLVKLPDSLTEIGVLIEPLTVVEKGVIQSEEIQKRMTWTPHEAVVTGAGPIGLMATMLLRSRGYDVYTLDVVERDSLRAQMVEACGAHYVKGDEEPLSALCARVGGIDLIVEATAVAQIVFDAIDAIGPNGVVCLTGVSAGSRSLQIPADKLNLEMVLDNKVVFGTVNANRRYFEAAVQDLQTFEKMWPGLCSKVITRRVPFDAFEEALTPRPGIDVKSTVSFR
ncbi:MAG: glucose 1-dehydrogenase [Actinobacteria bacterium]|nr:glucose 1-dehydrogenase [Actinomycetota bacterium]